MVVNWLKGGTGRWLFIAMFDAREPIAAVILAAGESRRMGRPKQLLPWGGTTILGQTIAQVQAAGFDQILLVSGACREDVEAIARELAIPTLYNPDYARWDLLVSLQLAVRELQRTTRPAGVLVMLGDLPFIPPGIMEAVVAAFRQGRGTIVAPNFRGHRGHPVLFGAAVFSDLLDLPPTARPRDLLDLKTDEVADLPVDDPVILRDIDTPEAYERWRPAGDES